MTHQVMSTLTGFCAGLSEMTTCYLTCLGSKSFPVCPVLGHLKNVSVPGCPTNPLLRRMETIWQLVVTAHVQHSGLKAGIVDGR